MESKLKIYLIIFLICVVIESANTMRDFHIIFRKLNCTIKSTNYVAKYKCWIQQLPRNRGNYISTYILFKEDIAKFMLEFTLNWPSKENLETEMLKFRLNGCKLDSYRVSHPLLSAMLEKLRSTANFPKNCPFKANFNYTVNKFSINPDYFPPFTPNMNFAAKVNVFMGKLHLLEINATASIQKKKTL